MNKQFKYLILFIGIVLVTGFAFSYALAVDTPSAEVYQPGQTAGPTMQSAKVDPSPVDRGKAVTISVTASDVSGVSTAVANIKNSSGTTLAIVQLYDDGRHSDGTAGDGVFANTWNVGTIVDGQYPIEIQLADALGHPTIKPAALTIIVGTGFNNVNTYCYQNFCNTAPSDSIPPTVSITAPASGATVTGTAAVSANAADNIGVSGVQFKLDGANLGAEDTAAPYSTSWDSTTASNGSHTLTAVARDAAGNTTTATAVTVTVSNVATDTTPPTVAITTPATDGTTLSTASYNVVANAVDSDGVLDKVEFYLDAETLPRATQIAGADNPPGSHDYTWVYTVTGTSNGSHTLKVIAYNAAGLTATATRPIIVQLPTSGPPYNVVITAPANGSSFSDTSTINFTITANDDTSVTKVDLFSTAGGGPIQSVTANGPSVTVNMAVGASSIAYFQDTIKSYAMERSGIRLPFVRTARAAELAATNCPSGYQEVCTTTTAVNTKGVYATAYDATSSTNSPVISLNISTPTTTCSCQAIPSQTPTPSPSV